VGVFFLNTSVDYDDVEGVKPKEKKVIFCKENEKSAFTTEDSVVQLSLVRQWGQLLHKPFRANDTKIQKFYFPTSVMSRL